MLLGRDDDSIIYIGRKPAMNYVMAAMVVLSDKKPMKILARGRSISRAVDVGEILLRTFSKGSAYGKIVLSTEVLTNKDGTTSNVSAIEIEILPPKK
jgi:DNA-binding protein